MDLTSAAALLGRKGGLVKSKAKRKASAENGKLGGRPRKEAKFSKSTCSVRDLVAECTFEPRGEIGLEGYQLGDNYKAQEVRKEKKKWFRVYPDDSSDYYETCSVTGFNQYFKEVRKASA